MYINVGWHGEIKQFNTSINFGLYQAYIFKESPRPHGTVDGSLLGN